MIQTIHLWHHLTPSHTHTYSNYCSCTLPVHDQPHETVYLIPTGRLGRFSTSRHMSPPQIGSQITSHTCILCPSCTLYQLFSFSGVTILVVPSYISFCMYYLPKRHMMGVHVWTSQVSIFIIVFVVTKNTSPKQSLGNDYIRDRDRHRQIVALSLGSQDLRDTWTCRTTFCQTLNKDWSGTTYGDLTEFITHTPDIVLFPTHVLVCGEYVRNRSTGCQK